MRPSLFGAWYESWRKLQYVYGCGMLWQFELSGRSNLPYLPNFDAVQPTLRVIVGGIGSLLSEAAQFID
jgi:hypothetical protein